MALCHKTQDNQRVIFPGITVLGIYDLNGVQIKQPKEATYV